MGWAARGEGLQRAHPEEEEGRGKAGKKRRIYKFVGWFLLLLLLLSFSFLHHHHHPPPSPRWQGGSEGCEEESCGRRRRGAELRSPCCCFVCMCPGFLLFLIIFHFWRRGGKKDPVAAALRRGRGGVRGGEVFLIHFRSKPCVWSLCRQPDLRRWCCGWWLCVWGVPPLPSPR